MTSSIAARGAGSKHSPIIISDDEGESSVDPQLSQEPHSTPLDLKEVNAKERSKAPKGMKMMLNMGYTPGLGLGRNLDGPVEPVPLVLKRKRDEGGVGCDRHSPTRAIVERLEGAFLKPESKKARKRRRRLERETVGRPQSWEHHNAPQRLAVEIPQPSFDSKPWTWPDHEDSGSVSALHSWPGAGPAFNPYEYSPASDVRFQRPPPNDSLPRFSLSLENSAFDTMHHNTGLAMSMPPFESVIPPVQASNIGGRLPARPHFSHGPLGPHSLDCPLLPMSQPGPLRLPAAQVPPKPIQVASGPPSVKKVLPIGMKHHHGQDTMHGLFHRSISQASDRRPYMPDPSCTLVIEQLPKGKGNREFLRNWCKRVCGAAPVHMELDANRKALVELESVEMARALFSSPRFQNDPGKAAIRVWWYRLDEPELADDDGEIEEGEIEEDDSHKWQRLTKKEKKAQKKVNKKKEQIKQHREVIPGRARSRLNGGITSNNNAHFESQSSIDASPLLPFEPATLAEHSSSHPANNHHLPILSFRGECSSTVLPLADEPESHSQDIAVCRSRDIVGSLLADDDHASIASSRHESPLVISTIPTKEAEVDSFSENMEVDSPVRSLFLNGCQDSNHRMSASQTVTPAPPKNVKGTTASTAPVPRPQSHQPAPPSHLDIPSSLSLNSPVHGTTSAPSLECTPTLSSNIISEPRVMKIPPKGPSHAKRSLEARQKELEERIARSKLELSQANNGTGPNVTPSDSTSAGTSVRPDTVTLTAPALPTEGTEPPKVAEETHLRRLVLESKRKKALDSMPHIQKMASEAESPSSALPHSNDTAPNICPISDVTFLVYSGTSDSPATSAVSGSFNSAPGHDALEDLAVSFITEAIQTTKPLPLKPSPATMKLELAAKQRWLERQIAESKLLMSKLNLAQTKQEKDAILRVMRERSRFPDSEIKPSAVYTGTASHHLDRSISQATDIPSRVRWPETTDDAGIFIVSDDEEEV